MAVGAERAVHVRIEGRVQGVGYRAWLEAEAVARDLTGWVANRLDGAVEAVIAGPRHAVDDMLRTCWRGPSPARVTQVYVQDQDDAHLAGFEIRRTY
jgi:acylphosphatase